MTADELTEAMRPLDGNPYAALVLCRLAMADDPDAEVERIRADFEPVFRRLADLFEAFRPLLRVFYDAMGPN